MINFLKLFRNCKRNKIINSRYLYTSYESDLKFKISSGIAISEIDFNHILDDARKSKLVLRMKVDNRIIYDKDSLRKYIDEKYGREISIIMKNEIKTILIDAVI